MCSDYYNNLAEAMKAFVDAAKDFETTHSRASRSLMNEHLNVLATTCDSSIFAPGRPEVSALFGSLQRVMRDPGGPHWDGAALLSRACDEPSAQYALTHDYKFMPCLTTLMSSNPTNKRKILLLGTMERITNGIKISRQESYLPPLMKSLTNWIKDYKEQLLVAQRALSVLTNVCSGNLPAVNALGKIVNTDKFVCDVFDFKIISDITTSKLMELYSYKIVCLKLKLQRASSEHGAILQHSVDFMEATYSSLQDLLDTAVMQNEKLSLVMSWIKPSSEKVDAEIKLWEKREEMLKRKRELATLKDEIKILEKKMKKN